MAAGASRREWLDMIEVRTEAGIGSMLLLCLIPRMREALSGREGARALGLEMAGVVTVM